MSGGGGASTPPPSEQEKANAEVAAEMHNDYVRTYIPLQNTYREMIAPAEGKRAAARGVADTDAALSMAQGARGARAAQTLDGVNPVGGLAQGLAVGGARGIAAAKAGQAQRAQQTARTLQHAALGQDMQADTAAIMRQDAATGASRVITRMQVKEANRKARNAQIKQGLSTLAMGAGYYMGGAGGAGGAASGGGYAAGEYPVVKSQSAGLIKDIW